MTFEHGHLLLPPNEIQLKPKTRGIFLEDVYTVGKKYTMGSAHWWLDGGKQLEN